VNGSMQFSEAGPHILRCNCGLDVERKGVEVN
jgi:hypothetical protein